MIKKLLITLALLLAPNATFAQCNGVFSAGNICGNPGPGAKPPTQFPASSLVVATPPGGTSGQIQYNNSGVFGGFTASGDATINPLTGAVAVTKLNNVPVNPASSVTNDILYYNGTSYVHTALMTLQNLICSATPSVCRLFYGYADVRWYGAVCNGVTNDTTAFNAALTSAYGVTVVVPTGVTCIVQNVTPPSVTSLITLGANPYSTVLKAPSANIPLILMQNGVVDVNIRGFWLDRVVTATAGGDGIQHPGYNENINIEDMYIINQWTGLRLGVTGSSYVRRTLISDCFNHGIWILPDTTASGGIGGGQWQLHDVLSSKNNGNGIAVDSSLTNTGSLTLGNWSNIRTFANHGVGISLGGKTSNGIGDLVLSGFFGGDSGGGYELLIDSYAGNNNFINVNIEQVGTQANGRGLSFPAPNSGTGIYVSANNTQTTFTGINVNGSAGAGMENAGIKTVISGANLNFNGQSGTGSIGLYHSAGNLTGSGIVAQSQQYGIYVGIDSLALAGVNVQNNSIAGLFWAVAHPISVTAAILQ